MEKMPTGYRGVGPGTSLLPIPCHALLRTGNQAARRWPSDESEFEHISMSI